MKHVQSFGISWLFLCIKSSYESKIQILKTIPFVKGLNYEVMYDENFCGH